MQKQVIYLGADHAGFELKEFLKHYLTKKGHEVYDEGAHKLDKLDDYPDYALKVANEVADNLDAKGILCCGSAQGMCIAANKISGIRAVAPANKKKLYYHERTTMQTSSALRAGRFQDLRREE